MSVYLCVSATVIYMNHYAKEVYFRSIFKDFFFAILIAYCSFITKLGPTFHMDI